MKILIAGSVQGDGGYEEAALCRLLEQELRALGHTTDRFLLPYERNMLSLPDQLLAYSLFQISRCDQLITVGYPACVLRHPNKICYLLQMEPMLAEYWDSGYGVLANRQYSDLLHTVEHINRESLKTARRVCAVSHLLAEDISARYGVTCGELLYPALEDNEEKSDLKNGDSGKYILCETNLLPWQRPELIVRLFSEENSNRDWNVRLFVPNSNVIYREELHRQIRAHALEERLMVYERRARKADFLNAAGIFIPDCQARRLSNAAVSAIQYCKPLLAMQDGGAVSQVLPRHNCLRPEDLPHVFERIHRFETAQCGLPEPKSFAEELLVQ